MHLSNIILSKYILIGKESIHPGVIYVLLWMTRAYINDTLPPTINSIAF